MDEHERHAMIESLNNGRDVLLISIRGVPDNLAIKRPSPERWSVLECVEHVAVAEEYLLAQIVASKRCDVSAINKKREAAIQERGLDRTRRIDAPDVAKPTGRFDMLQSAVQHFLLCRERTIQFVGDCTDDPRAMLTEHPIIGRVNCYEMLLMMALHPQRHAKQIEDIRADV
jgi:hypothetical protein